MDLNDKLQEIIHDRITKEGQFKIDTIKQRFSELTGTELDFKAIQIKRYISDKSESYYYNDIHLVTFYETEHRFDSRTQRYYIALKYRF